MFGRQLEQMAAAGDQQGFHQLIDWTALLEKATDVAQANPERRAEFIKGAKKSLAGSRSFSSEVVAACQAEATYRLLRVRHDERHSRVLMRLVFLNGGVNYHEYDLRTDGEGTRADDIYVYFSGEFMSQTLRRYFLQDLAAKDRSWIDRLRGVESDFVKHLPAIERMNESNAAGNFANTLAAFETLPPTLQKDKIILLNRTRAAQEVGNAEYLDALTDLRRHYPDDPSTALNSIDYFSLQGEHDRALASIDTLDEQVEGDPYLKTLAASIHLQKEDPATARALCAEAIATEPDLVNAYAVLLDIAVMQGEYQEAAERLTQLEYDFGLRFEDLQSVPGYEEFTQSEAYQQWLDARPTDRLPAETGPAEGEF